MAIGNCQRCGAPVEDENELCYQCALRRIDVTFDASGRSLIDEYEEWYAGQFGFVYPLPTLAKLYCDYCGASFVPPDHCPNCGIAGLG